MRPLSQALLALITCAEDIVVRPATLPQRPSASFFELCSEIEFADDKPAEFERTTSAAMVMIPAIKNFFAQAKVDHHWQMVVGALLPLLRIDAYQQFQHERESLKSETNR